MREPNNPLKKLKGLAGVVIVLGIGYSFLVGLNHLAHSSTNVNINGDSKTITKWKAKGAFSRTREYFSEDNDCIHHSVDEMKLFSSIELDRFISKNRKDYRSDEVTVSSFSKYISYSDGNGDGPYDGLVDKIYISSLHPVNGVSGWLERDKHYKDFKEQFDEGDRVLAEAKENFKHYFKY